jgi:biopolymer transport protein ExbD
MRVPNHVRDSSLSINMTPMIDVVFQLIIFFLVSSHLAKQEAQLPLPLPLAASGSKEGHETNPRVTINVLADGQLSLAGKHLPVAELQQRLHTKLAEAGTDLEVRIRSDRHVAYRHVEPILLACAHAGVWNVAFAVYRPEDER